MVYGELTHTTRWHNIETRWRDDLNDESFSLPENVQRVKMPSTSTKLQSFQYRLLMRAIVTNVNMKHWRMCDSDLCTFCEGSRENYFHLFYACPLVQPIIECVRELHQKMSGEDVELSFGDIICNAVSSNPKSASNTVCLVAKQYVYRKRCQKLSLDVREFRREIEKCKSIEKYLAIKENNVHSRIKGPFCGHILR